MATNGEYLEQIEEHLNQSTGEHMVGLVLGEHLPTVADGASVARAFQWEVMAVYAMLQRKRAFLETIRDHLASMDPEATDDHPRHCGDPNCILASQQMAVGEAALGILTGQAGEVIEAPAGMSAADVQAVVNGTRLADEVEAYVRDQNKDGGYL